MHLQVRVDERDCVPRLERQHADRVSVGSARVHLSGRRGPTSSAKVEPGADHDRVVDTQCGAPERNISSG